MARKTRVNTPYRMNTRSSGRMTLFGAPPVIIGEGGVNTMDTGGSLYIRRTAAIAGETPDMGVLNTARGRKTGGR